VLPIDGPDTLPRVPSGESLPKSQDKSLKQFYKNVPQKALQFNEYQKLLKFNDYFMSMPKIKSKTRKPNTKSD
jgi:hypothetical protein